MNELKEIYHAVLTVTDFKGSFCFFIFFQKNDALLKEIEQLKEQYVIKFQEVTGRIGKNKVRIKCTFHIM